MKRAEKLLADYSKVLGHLKARAATLERAAAGALYVRNRVEGALLERRAEAAALRSHLRGVAGERSRDAVVREIAALELELEAAKAEAARSVDAYREAKREVAEAERERLRVVLFVFAESSRPSRRELERTPRLEALRAELDELAIERDLA